MQGGGDQGVRFDSSNEGMLRGERFAEAGQVWPRETSGSEPIKR